MNLRAQLPVDTFARMSAETTLFSIDKYNGKIGEQNITDEQGRRYQYVLYNLIKGDKLFIKYSVVIKDAQHQFPMPVSLALFHIDKNLPVLIQGTPVEDLEKIKPTTLVYVVPESGPYRLKITTNNPTDTGLYSLKSVIVPPASLNLSKESGFCQRLKMIIRNEEVDFVFTTGDQVKKTEMFDALHSLDYYTPLYLMDNSEHIICKYNSTLLDDEFKETVKTKTKKEAISLYKKLIDEIRSCLDKSWTGSEIKILDDYYIYNFEKNDYYKKISISYQPMDKGYEVGILY